MRWLFEVLFQNWGEFSRRWNRRVAWGFARRTVLFRGLSANSKALLFSALCWTVPLAAFSGYVNLYLLRLGFSEAQIGGAHGLVQGLAFFFFIVAAVLVDRFERKKLLIFFDILSWLVYALGMALAPTAGWAFFALLFQGTNAVANTTYQCLLLDGVSVRGKSRVLGVQLLVNMGPAVLFLPLLGGLTVEMFGLVPAVRGWFLFFAFCVAAGIFWRAWKLSASTPSDVSRPFWKVVSENRRVLSAFFARPGARLVMTAKLLDFSARMVWQVYFPLFFVEHWSMKDSDFSVLLQAQVFFLFLWLWGGSPSFRWLLRRGGWWWDGFLVFVLFMLLLFADAGRVWIFGFLFVVLYALSTVLNQIVNEAVWMTLVQEKERGKVIAVLNAFVRLLLFLLIPAAGWLYERFAPEACLVVLGVLHGTSAFFWWKVEKRTRRFLFSNANPLDNPSLKA